MSEDVISPNSVASKELERIAMKYIDALLSADGSDVPLSENVRRSHLMVIPGKPLVWQEAQGADVIRPDFQREALTVRKNMRVTVDTERSSVVVLWESGMDNEFAKAITIMDRFVIRDGLITELEIISIPQSTAFSKIAYPGWEKVMAGFES